MATLFSSMEDKARPARPSCKVPEALISCQRRDFRGEFAWSNAFKMLLLADIRSH